MSHSSKLVYPFSIPIGVSYACKTESTATVTSFSNANRFTQITNQTDEEVVALSNEGGSPVIQFTGLQVSHHNTRLANSFHTNAEYCSTLKLVSYTIPV